MLDRAVVNAGPLVALSLAGRLDLLPALFKDSGYPKRCSAKWLSLASGDPARWRSAMQHG